MVWNSANSRGLKLYLPFPESVVVVRYFFLIDRLSREVEHTSPDVCCLLGIVGLCDFRETAPSSDSAKRNPAGVLGMLLVELLEALVKTCRAQVL